MVLQVVQGLFLSKAIGSAKIIMKRAISNKNSLPNPFRNLGSSSLMSE